MAIRMGPTLVAGLVEGGERLVNEQNRRKAMAQKYALLEMEKKLIAHRDLLAHGYRMDELKKQHEQRMAEIAAMNAWRNQPKQVSEEERMLLEAQIEKEQAQADRYRRMNREDQDQRRKELETNAKLLKQRMDDITFTTKGEMGERPVRQVYEGYGDEYYRTKKNYDSILVQLGAMDPAEFENKYRPVTSKPDPVQMGLVPANVAQGATQYGGSPQAGMNGGQQGAANDPLGLR